MPSWIPPLVPPVCFANPHFEFAAFEQVDVHDDAPGLQQLAYAGSRHTASVQPLSNSVRFAPVVHSPWVDIFWVVVHADFAEATQAASQPRGSVGFEQYAGTL